MTTKKAKQMIIENGKTVVREVNVVMDTPKAKPVKAEVAATVAPVRNYVETRRQEQPISVDTKARLFVVELKRVTYLDEPVVIDLTNYAKAPYEQREAKTEQLINILRSYYNNGVIPGSIEFKADVRYVIPETVTNQLGFLYGAGSIIIINGHEFINPKPGTLLRYNILKGHEGLTEQAKTYFGTKQFTLSGLQFFNQKAIAQGTESYNKAWAQAEAFFRQVMTTEIEGVTVFQPNQKVYKEVTAQRYLKRQLMEITPVTQIVKDNMKVTKKYFGHNSIYVKVDYEQTADLVLGKLVLSEEQQLELDLKRAAYGIDHDNIHYMEVNVETPHGYAQSIPQVYLGKSVHSVSSGYAGGDAHTQANSNKTKNVSIWSQETHFNVKAYVNYNILKAYEKYGLLEEGYAICDKCGMPTKSEHAYCDVCGQLRDEAKTLINTTVKEVTDATKAILKRNNVSPKLVQYRLTALSEEVLYRMDFTDLEVKDGKIVQKQEPTERIEVYAEVKAPGNGNRRLPKYIEKAKEDK